MNRFLHRVGHRGAPFHYPSNTLQSFNYAIERGCTMVECDIRPSAEGVLVLAHDESVTTKEGEVFVVSEWTAERLHALDLGAGEGVPTLEDLVGLVQGRCSLMADMKCEGGEIEAQVVKALSALPTDAKIVPGAGFESRARFRELDPTLPLSLSLNLLEGDQIAREDWLDWVLSLDVQAVTWQYPLLTPERIQGLQSRGLKVFAWTVDDKEIMLQMRERGVDGIISNRTEWLCESA